MPAAPHLKLVKSDRNATAETPALPAANANERPLPDLGGAKGRAFIGVVALSLVIHGAIIAASIDWPVVDEERGAGSGETTVTLDAVDVILLDRMPSVRPPLTTAVPVGETAPARPLADTPLTPVAPQAAARIPTQAAASDTTVRATELTGGAGTRAEPVAPADATAFTPAAPVSDAPVTAVTDAPATAPKDSPNARVVVADRPSSATAETREPITASQPAQAVEAEAVAPAPTANATTASAATEPQEMRATLADTLAPPATPDGQPSAMPSTPARVAPDASPNASADRAVVIAADDPTAEAIEERSPVDTPAVAATTPRAIVAAPVAPNDLQANAGDDRTVAAEPVPAPPIPPKRPDPPPATASTVPAPPTATPPTASAPARANAGTGGRAANAAGRAKLSSYRSKLVAHLRRFTTYPDAARRRRIEGSATVSFTIDRRGRVVAASLAKRAGHAILDRAALAMVRRASPFPPIPPDIGRAQVTVRAPIRFAVR